jgi:hypothetical protein
MNIGRMSPALLGYGLRTRRGTSGNGEAGVTIQEVAPLPEVNLGEGPTFVLT